MYLSTQWYCRTTTMALEFFLILPDTRHVFKYYLYFIIEFYKLTKS